MQTDTIIVIVLGICLLGVENPLGQLEYFGFPVAYLFAATLLFYGFSMRRRLLDERRVAETVSLSQLRSWNENTGQTRQAQEERMWRTE